MPIQIPLTALAVGLAVLGFAALRYQRRAVRRNRYSTFAVAIGSLLAVSSIVGAVGLVGFTFYPRGGGTAAPGARPSTPREAGLLPVRAESTDRSAVIGTWTDNYRGKRTMTLKEDGTGTMVVELTGVTAVLYAKRLRFDMIWSIEDRRLKKQTVGGEPADKVELILKLMGDEVDEPILELTEDRLVLLDKDETTKYTWTRVR